MFFPENFQNKKILIFGYGKTGKSVQNYFIKNKIKYTIWDDNKKLNIKKIDKKKILLKKYDYIILSPGVDIYHHQKKVFLKTQKKYYY